MSLAIVTMLLTGPIYYAVARLYLKDEQVTGPTGVQRRKAMKRVVEGWVGGWWWWWVGWVGWVGWGEWGFLVAASILARESAGVEDVSVW